MGAAGGSLMGIFKIKAGILSRGAKFGREHFFVHVFLLGKFDETFLKMIYTIVYIAVVPKLQPGATNFWSIE